MIDFVAIWILGCTWTTNKWRIKVWLVVVQTFIFIFKFSLNCCITFYNSTHIFNVFLGFVCSISFIFLYCNLKLLCFFFFFWAIGNNGCNYMDCPLCIFTKNSEHQLQITRMIECTWNSTRHELDLTFYCRTLKVGSKATAFDATWKIVCNLCSNG